MPRPGSAAAGAAAALYLLLLGAARWIPPAAFAAAALAAAALPVWCWRAGRPRRDTVLAAWPVLHLLLLATGSLASPLLPLVGLWGFALAIGGAPQAALAAALASLVPVAQAVVGRVPAPGPLLSYGLLLGCAVGATELWRHATRRTPPERSGQAAPTPPAEPAEVQALHQALEVVRLATDAHEASLWRADDDGSAAHRIASASLPGRVPEADQVLLSGHPFSWSLLEGAHFRLERNRQPLPASWAAEMLLVPVDPPRELLALAYTVAAPPGAERAAAAAGEHLQGMRALLRGSDRGTELARRLAALHDAIRLVPGELELDAFAAGLGAAAIGGTGAEGAALALWDAELGSGRIVWAQGGPAGDGALGRIDEGDSRLALAAKHGVALDFEDLHRERDVRALLRGGERWEVPPALRRWSRSRQRDGHLGCSPFGTPAPSASAARSSPFWTTSARSPPSRCTAPGATRPWTGAPRPTPLRVFPTAGRSRRASRRRPTTSRATRGPSGW